MWWASSKVSYVVQWWPVACEVYEVVSVPWVVCCVSCMWWGAWCFVGVEYCVGCMWCACDVAFMCDSVLQCVGCVTGVFCGMYVVCPSVAHCMLCFLYGVSCVCRVWCACSVSLISCVAVGCSMSVM